MSFLDQIRHTVARYRLLQPGDRVGVAVSGGADSVCLLHSLFELRAELALQLSVVHVDHNLRGAESRADADFVHSLAQSLNIPFHLRTLDLSTEPGNLEQAAREARYRLFQELVDSRIVDKIAVGHTRSDQAETVLFRLLRGSGSAGLAGIRPFTESQVIRPLILTTRSEGQDYLRERGIAWRQDSTNSDLRFDRNRIRHQLIPSLESAWNPKIEEILAQTADWAFEEERYWQTQVQDLISSDWVRSVEGALVLDADKLTALPVAVARRLIREAVRQVKHDLLGVGFGHIEAIRELAGARTGSGRRQIAGIQVFRSYNWLRFAKSLLPASDWQIPVAVPGCYTLPLENRAIRLERIRNNGVYNGSLNALDGERACGPLVLRNWRAGDRYRRMGHAGTEKVKRLFQEHRVPSWERRNWPILSAGDAVVWASGFGPADEFSVVSESRTVVTIRETREGEEKL